MQCNVYRLMFFVTKTVFAERLSLSKVFELYRAGGATWWGYDTGSNPALCFLFFIVTDIQLCSPCQLRCAPACGFDHFWLRWNLATWRWHQNILYLDVHPSYNGGMKGVRITMVVPQLFGIGPTCSIGSIGLTLPNLAMQAVAVWIYIYIVAAEPINPIWKCSRAVFGTAFWQLQRHSGCLTVWDFVWYIQVTYMYSQLFEGANVESHWTFATGSKPMEWMARV